jgi:hypothetical protein
MQKILLFLFVSTFSLQGQIKDKSTTIDFTIDTQTIVGENTEFWKATGSDHLFYHVPRPSGQALLDRMVY